MLLLPKTVFSTIILNFHENYIFYNNIEFSWKFDLEISKLLLGKSAQIGHRWSIWIYIWDFENTMISMTNFKNKKSYQFYEYFGVQSQSQTVVNSNIRTKIKCFS